jgi:uncharacterized protein
MVLEPDLMVSSVNELTPQVLRQHGIRAVMVDLDDTLVARKSHSLAPLFRTWLASLKAEQMPVLILSNGQPARVAHWANELGIQGFALVGKPFRFAFRRGLKALGMSAAETVMIGDQLFTDVLGAKLMGMKSILVQPLSPHGLPHTRVLRKVEKLLLKRG